MTHEILNVDTGGLSTASEGKNEMENGARSDVQVAGGLVVWPVGMPGGKGGEVKEMKGGINSL